MKDLNRTRDSASRRRNKMDEAKKEKRIAGYLKNKYPFKRTGLLTKISALCLLRLHRKSKISNGMILPSCFQNNRGEVGLIGRVGKVLRFQTEGCSKIVFHP